MQPSRLTLVSPKRLTTGHKIVVSSKGSDQLHVLAINVECPIDLKNYELVSTFLEDMRGIHNGEEILSNTHYILHYLTFHNRRR